MEYGASRPSNFFAMVNNLICLLVNTSPFTIFLILDFDCKMNLGRAIDFEGSRSEKDILNFVNRASGPAVKEPKKTLAALGWT